MGHPQGDASGQQTWEALSLLVSLRCWAQQWKQQRIRLEARGDSISALTIMLKLKSKGRGPTIVAREVSLELADCSFFPDVVAHTPGIANKLSDLLSRKFLPGRPFLLPDALSAVPETQCPIRDKSFYLALDCP